MPEISLGSSSSAWIALNQRNNSCKTEFSRRGWRLHAKKEPTLTICQRNPAACIMDKINIGKLLTRFKQQHG